MLTIQPGVVVKFEAGATLVVKEGATLNAVGTAPDRIVFTSMKDDTARFHILTRQGQVGAAALDTITPGWTAERVRVDGLRARQSSEQQVISVRHLVPFRAAKQHRDVLAASLR